MNTIQDIIGEGKAFEPPFRRRGKNVKDKNLRTLVQVKAYGSLRDAEGINQTEGGIAIAQHICDLLNREHCEKENPRREWLSKCCDVVRNTNLSEDIKEHLINTFMRL